MKNLISYGFSLLVKSLNSYFLIFIKSDPFKFIRTRIIVISDT